MGRRNDRGSTSRKIGVRATRVTCVSTRTTIPSRRCSGDTSSRVARALCFPSAFRMKRADLGTPKTPHQFLYRRFSHPEQEMTASSSSSDTSRRATPREDRAAVMSYGGSHCLVSPPASVARRARVSELSLTATSAPFSRPVRRRPRIRRQRRRRGEDSPARGAAREAGCGRGASEGKTRGGHG